MFMDEIERKLWKERERLLAEEADFEESMAFLLEWVDWIKELPDETLLSYFREDGGDQEMGAEEARREMLESLVVDRW